MPTSNRSRESSDCSKAAPHAGRPVPLVAPVRHGSERRHVRGPMTSGLGGGGAAVPERLPLLRATLLADATGTLSINGVEHPCAAGSYAQLRAGVVARAVVVAATVRRPVRLELTDGSGTQLLSVAADGALRLLDVDAPVRSTLAPALEDSPCRRCQVPQQVTATTCVRCGALEPHRVELTPVAVLDADALIHPDDEVLVRLRSTLATSLRAPVVNPRTDRPAGESRVPSGPSGTPSARPDGGTARSAPRALSELPLVRLEFSTQAPVTVTGRIALGRNPTPVDGRAPVSVASPSMRVSKTHAFVDVDPTGRITVTDCRSTNGTRVLGETPLLLTPGRAQEIAPGTTLELGDVRCTVRLGG